MFKVEYLDDALRDLFLRLRNAVVDTTPLMQEIGEHGIETTKQRFQRSRAPDGTPWVPNRPSTFLRLVSKYKGATGKDGRLNKSGAARVMAKKPLIGETRSLSTTINYRAGRDFVEIGSSMVYAGVMQKGAAARSFAGGKTPWGDIPARPFLGLSRDDAEFIQDAGVRHLEQAAKGS